MIYDKVCSLQTTIIQVYYHPQPRRITKVKTIKKALKKALY